MVGSSCNFRPRCEEVAGVKVSRPTAWSSTFALSEQCVSNAQWQCLLCAKGWPQLAAARIVQAISATCFRRFARCLRRSRTFDQFEMGGPDCKTPENRRIRQQDRRQAFGETQVIARLTDFPPPRNVAPPFDNAHPPSRKTTTMSASTSVECNERLRRLLARSQERGRELLQWASDKWQPRSDTVQHTISHN